MKLVLRLSNFRSFSADYTDLDLDDLTFLLGPNGAGKTAVLQALARMFSLDPALLHVSFRINLDTHQSTCLARMVFHSAGASIIEHAKERKSGSHWTLCWRKPDSNHRSRGRPPPSS
jgi:predicted ATP-binding protein involved in virulence